MTSLMIGIVFYSILSGKILHVRGSLELGTVRLVSIRIEQIYKAPLTLASLANNESRYLLP
jgi:hypothetical protein